jgi:hypothetical protein
METFNVISIVQVEHLTHLLKWLEARQIPYNVELNSPKRAPRVENGSTNKALVLSLLSKRPMSVKELGDAFLAVGRKRHACHGPLHQLKKDKTITSKNGVLSINKGAGK